MGNFDFQCTKPVLGQHWADLNADIGPVTLANLWLPRLGQYWAVFSVPTIRTWGPSIIILLFLKAKLSIFARGLIFVDQLYFKRTSLGIIFIRCE